MTNIMSMKAEEKFELILDFIEEMAKITPKGKPLIIVEGAAVGLLPFLVLLLPLGSKEVSD